MQALMNLSLWQWLAFLTALVVAWDAGYDYQTEGRTKSIFLVVLVIPIASCVLWPTWLVQIELSNRFSFNTFTQVTIPMVVGLILGGIVGSMHGHRVFKKSIRISRCWR